MKRVHRIHLAALHLALGLAVICVLPGRTLASGNSASRPPVLEGPRVTRPAPELGSPENPIPIPGTETRVIVLGAVGPPGRIPIRMGWLRGWLMGTPGVVLTRGGGPDPMGDVTLPMQLNAFTGGAIETALGRSSGFYLEGGRVLLRDPIDVLGWGQGDGNYWTSSAGLAVRF
jgi:hypothetical protein